VKQPEDAMTCPVCEDPTRGPNAGHWCDVQRTFVGDPTMGALEFEMEFGDPASEEKVLP
jgi:hypothetical protein